MTSPHDTDEGKGYCRRCGEFGLLQQSAKRGWTKGAWGYVTTWVCEACFLGKKARKVKEPEDADD